MTVEIIFSHWYDKFVFTVMVDAKNAIKTKTDKKIGKHLKINTTLFTWTTR